MNLNVLLIGLISLLLGLIGVVIKSNMKDFKVDSYSSAEFLGGIYILLFVGVVLIIGSFFVE